jgi:O-antigen/teichoic acid export membrane protein
MSTTTKKNVGVPNPTPTATQESRHAMAGNASDSPSIWRGVRRDVAVLGAGTAGIILAQLAFRTILIAALVPASYGRLSLILSLYNTVMIIGISGLPDSAARYIAISPPDADYEIVRSAVRAGILPTLVASVVVAAVAGIVLNSWSACLFAAVGLASLVYSLLTLGILRGRGRLVAAASIMPIAALTEVVMLTTLWKSDLGLTQVSAFSIFCLGNVIGLLIGAYLTIRSSPKPQTPVTPSSSDGWSVPSPRELLGFSVWLTLATVGIAAMPLIMRFAAAFNSYTVVAMVDVALVLLSLPQRVGSVIVSAVIPHASRAVRQGQAPTTITCRENLIAIVPFVIAAALVAFTPLVEWLFSLLGRPEYSQSSNYLALALLAGPARVLYGLVQGVLVAHGEGRFLAWNSLGITVIASVFIFAATAMGDTPLAFAIFVVACWAVYLSGLVRISHLRVDSASILAVPSPETG